MDKLSWFKFSISDWIMGKIMKCPEVTQARFIRLCCLYWNKGCQLDIDDAEIEIGKDQIDILLSKKVIKIESETIVIKFLDEQNGSIKETSKKRRDAVNERWGRIKSNTNSGLCNSSELQNDTSVLQSDTEKSREEESREEKVIISTPVVPTESIDPSKFIESFNSFAGRKFKVTQKTKDTLKVRLKDYTKKEIFTAIKNAHKDPFHKENNFKYLTPEFILRPDKMERYLNFDPAKQKAAANLFYQTTN